MKHTYFLFGNSTFLDNYGASLLAMPGYEIACTDNSPFLAEGYCINIIGDYTIEVIFPKEITQYYTLFFETVRDMTTFNPTLFAQIIKMKSTCMLKIIHSPEQASKMKKQIMTTYYDS